MSSVLDNAQTQVVAGRITYSGGTPTLSGCNDDSATVADTATGVATITFGAPFLSAPVCTATIVDPTAATTAGHVVALVSEATNSIVFNVLTLSQAAGTNATDLAALADVNFNFMAIGKRNR